MNRTQCVLCRHTNLQQFYTLTKFPLTAASTTTDYSFDVFTDLEFKICHECRCVQLVTLVDPNILYANDNKAALTSLWNNHHTALAKFILNGPPINSICEVGGGSNPIVSFFSQPPKYTVLDIYECPNKVDSVTYKVGNCETYTDYEEETLLLSHTFEHLYDPHAFLERVCKSHVKNIFLSVPNFAKWLSENLTVSILFNQHTFYFEKQDVQALFSQYGFATIRVEEFGDHSLFFHFHKGAHLPIQIQPSKSEQAILRNFQIKPERIGELTIDRPFYIMPSFYIGQVVYHYMKKDMIIGFLDNDISKVGKRLYGTELLTYSPSDLITSEYKTVLLIRTPYFDEMYKQLSDMCSGITIHILDLKQ